MSLLPLRSYLKSRHLHLDGALLSAHSLYVGLRLKVGLYMGNVVI